LGAEGRAGSTQATVTARAAIAAIAAIDCQGVPDGAVAAATTEATITAHTRDACSRTRTAHTAVTPGAASAAGGPTGSESAVCAINAVAGVTAKSAITTSALDGASIAVRRQTAKATGTADTADSSIPPSTAIGRQ
jgi:hypothetical protein